MGHHNEVMEIDIKKIWFLVKDDKNFVMENYSSTINIKVNKILFSWIIRLVSMFKYFSIDTKC